MTVVQTSSVADREASWLGRLGMIEILFWVAMAAGGFLLPEHLVLLSQILIAGLFALSLDLLLGYAGIASLGHAAFFGIGAYAAGLLAKAGVSEPLTGLVLSAALAGAADLLCSLIVARLSGIAMLTVTLGIAMLLYELMNRASDFSGGDNGLEGVAMSPLLGLFPFDFYGHTGFWYCFVVTLAGYCGLRRLVRSPFGLALAAIRENVRRVPALGIPVRRRVMTAFTISAVIAGAAGALLTDTTQFVALEVLSFDRSAAALIMVIFGGAGTLIGSLLGAATYLVARDELAAINPTYWYFWLGLMLVGVVLFGRGGLMGWIDNLWRMFRKGRGGGE
jgi:branched-chain amino acid transport system permease protein